MRLTEVDELFLFIEDDPGVGDLEDPFSGLGFQGRRDLFPALDAYRRWEQDQLLAQSIAESKAVGSVAYDPFSRDKRYSRITRRPSYAREVRYELSAARKTFNSLQAEARAKMLRMAREFASGAYTVQEFQRLSADLLTSYYERIFNAGRKASGLVKFMPKETGPTQWERSWFRSAVRQELAYWNNFVDELAAGDVQFAPKGVASLPKPPRRRYYAEERIEMFIKSMESMFDSARVTGLPDNVLVYWSGPGIKDKRICLTGTSCAVASSRGRLPLRDVQPGDFVLTHRGRWRRVTGLHVNAAREEHRYAVVVGSGFELFGVTQDHRVWTDDGWRTAESAARKEANVCGFDMGVLQAVPEGRPLFSDLLGRFEDAARVPVSLALGDDVWSDPGRVCRAPQERGLVGRPFGEFGAPNLRRAPCEARCAAAFGGQEEEALAEVRHLRSQILGLSDGQSAAQLLGGVSGYLAETEEEAEEVRRMRGRDFRESVQAQGEEILLSRLLSMVAPGGRHDDPAVRLLWKEVQEKKVADTVVREGQVILLAGVLPAGSPLFDLSVEEDASFVVEGRAVHNCDGCAYIVERQPFPKELVPAVPRAGMTPCLTNCRHRLLVRRADARDITRRKRALPKRTSMVAALEKIMKERRGGRTRLRKPRGALTNPWGKR